MVSDQLLPLEKGKEGGSREREREREREKREREATRGGHQQMLCPLGRRGLNNLYDLHEQMAPRTNPIVRIRRLQELHLCTRLNYGVSLCVLGLHTRICTLYFPDL